MKWKAIVLGSGGAHGEFQIGSLPTIARYHRNFDFYAGVGVGSMHASVLAQYDDFLIGVQKLTRLWQGMKKNQDILDPRPFGTLGALISDEAWASDAVFGNQKLKESILKNIDWEKIKGKKNWAIRTTSLTDGLVYTISNDKDLMKATNTHKKHLKLSLSPNSNLFIGDKIYDFILAAGMVPTILPPVDIFNHRFIEGGIRDVAPLQTAVEAFKLAMQKGYTEAEFIIVNNYVSELDHEAPEKLDSGTEILLRAIKIMTIEMAKNDLILGQKMLEDLPDIQFSIKVMQPDFDTPLHPMDFGDLKNREALRRHGQEVALREFETINDSLATEIKKETEAALKAPESAEKVKKAVARMIEYPELTREAIHNFNQGKKKPRIAGEEKSWAIRYHDIRERKIFEPSSLNELKAFLKNKVGDHKNFKGLGSGYAFSNILETTGINIRLNKMKAFNAPRHLWIKPEKQSEYNIQIETGNVIQDLNEKLWNIGKALLNQPGYEHLNYFGVCTTGGHGSGHNIGPIAQAILSMNLLTIDEHGETKEYRIEPTDGITDPIKYQQSGIELIQDDDTFNSVLVSAGCMGIIYSIIIRTQDRFFLEEKRTCEIWEEIEESVDAKLTDPNIHSIHLWYNPYKIKNETHVVLSEYTMHPGPAKGSRPLGMSWNIVDELTPILVWLMNNNPKDIPKLLSSSLRATVNKKPVVMRCPKALNFGPPNHSPVHATNFALPKSRYKDFLGGFQDFCKSRARHNVYVTAPVGFRFTTPGRGFIAPQYNQDSCMVEVPILQRSPKALETIDAIHGLAFKEYEARPHWGQLNRVLNQKWFKKMYPEWKKFIATYDKFNKGHFDNEFTKQLGLRKLITEL